MSYKGLFSCEDKVAIVTGGAGLMGREIVKALHEFGAIVYMADIDMKGDDRFKNNSQIKAVSLDVTSKSSIKNAIKKVIKTEGRIDILVNSAYPRTKDWGVRFEDITYSSWTTNVNNHLGGYFLCCQVAAEEMKRSGGGSIVNLASIYGILGPDFSIYEGTKMTMPAAYAAIKGGIITLTKYIATYYAKYNVRANVVSPGGIYDNQPESFVERYSKKTPLGRMGMPSEVVGAVIYLASDASSYVTGHNLVVDGGWTAW